MPAKAVLRMRQLSLFSMICRLPGNILNNLAGQILLSDKKELTWFGQIESACYQYALPHPLQLLDNPPEKESFKKLTKLKVAEYWQLYLRNKIVEDELSSLEYFKPEYCSLLKPHPILYTAASAYEVNKMIVQLRLLSGRARLGSLTRHFSAQSDGVCELCNNELEDLDHLLLPRCKALKDRAEILLTYMRDILKPSIPCSLIFDSILAGSQQNSKLWIQFVLDCSSLPAVIQASQADSSVLPFLFKVTRTWCYSLYRTRLKILGRWST